MKPRDRKMLDVGRVWNATITLQCPMVPLGAAVFLDEYEDVASISAEVRYNRSRLYSQALAENTRRSLTFIIRYRDVPDDWRLIFNGQPYQIESVMPLESDRLYTQIDAYRYANDQVGEEHGF